jgi:hypothetical protein
MLDGDWSSDVCSSDLGDFFLFQLLNQIHFITPSVFLIA